MINIKYCSDKQVSIHFNGSSFHEVLQYCKNKKFKFDPSEKVWLTSPIKVSGVIEDLMDVDVINISDEDLTKIELASNSKPSITHTGIRYQNKLLKSEPLGSYQVEGIKESLRKNGFIFNWGTGTGKTYTTISVQNHLFKHGYTNKLIILTIGAVLYNWKRELQMFGNFKEDDIQIVTSDNKEPFDKDKKVLIMTYNTYRIISEYWAKKIKKREVKRPKQTYLPIRTWSDGKCSIILDEAHKIKTPTSKRSKWTMISSDEYVHKIIATATLTPKDFLDIYAPMSFLDKALVNNLSFNDFKEDVAYLGNRFSKYAVTGFKDERIEHWKSVFDPFISFVNKRDVIADKLAEFNRKPIFMELTDEQQSIYKRVIETFLFKNVKDGKVIIDVKEVKNTFPYALQALSDPLLLLDNDKIQEDSSVYPLLKKWKFNKSVRLEYCDSIIKDHLEEEPNSKFLIWCINPNTIERLAKHYSKYDPLFIHGSSTPSGVEKNKHRDDIINEFEKSNTHKILIANPPTIGVGQNIKAANVSIFWNRDFNYESYEQAQGRNDRPGGPWEEIYEYDLIFDRSLEVAVEKRLNDRKDLNKMFANEGVISKENIKNIFLGKF